MPPQCVNAMPKQVLDDFPAGCSKELFSKAAASEDPEAYPLSYVEGLNDATSLREALRRRQGTMLVASFNIMPHASRQTTPSPSSECC
jgi:hypothetical protein